MLQQDAIILEPLDSQKSQEIMKDVESFVKIRNKSNRKLARDVAEWVDVAMTASQNNNKSSNHNLLSASEEDLEIDNDDI